MNLVSLFHWKHPSRVSFRSLIIVSLVSIADHWDRSLIKDIFMT